jgi:hypothetical protein
MFSEIKKPCPKIKKPPKQAAFVVVIKPLLTLLANLHLSTRANSFSLTRPFLGNYIFGSPLDSPRRLVSLWEIMEIFLLSRFCQDFMWLAHKLDEVRAKMAKDGDVCKVNNQERENIRSSLEQLKVHCLEIKLDSVANPCFLLSIDLQLLRNDCYYRDVEKGLQAIHWAITQELLFRKFVFVPPGKDDYLEQENLFDDAGKKIFPSKVFPSAKDEIKSAGNCLAADLHTAAVFHLMRVVNIGLRELACSLGVPKIKGKKLEYCRDETIISEIETAIDKKLESVDALKRDEKWEKEKSFYQGLLVDLRYFKDVIRDPVAHARKSYTANGALDIYTHVRDFMRRLAERVSAKHERKIKKRAKEITEIMFAGSKSLGKPAK